MSSGAGLSASSLIRARTRIGQAELLILSDGPCLFDGGAIFGVVPKTLWSQRVQPDAENRIVLGLNTLLVRLDGRTVVIETGLGDKMPAKLKSIYGAKGRLPEAFAAAGVTPESVDLVINTHLHWDHCGWNTRRDEDGTLQPTFPRAQYLVHRGEVEHGRLQLDRDRISYLAENYEPLLATGQMRMLDTAPGAIEQVAPGIAVELFPGHTQQLMAVHIYSAGEHACYISDLIPTSAHLDPTWVMSYDLDPLRTIAERKRFYARAIPEQWLLVFTHDHAKPLGFLEEGPRGKPVLRSSS